MKVIAIVGLPAGGKGEFSRIADEMGIPVVVMGDVVRQAVLDAGLVPDDHSMGEMSRQLRERHGRDAIARLTIAAIESLDKPLVIVDGIRSDAEVKLYRDHFERFVLVGITSAFPVRLARLQVRRRPDDAVGEEGLRARDARELGWGLGEALKIADYTLINDSTIESFRADVRALLDTLKVGP
ncbi:MAG: flagellar hook-basal body complex protein FliE [Methanomicrobiaceae archaeon]|nr:flagellar hook-basal body complex protein FliE [Methanomicrobiaceae archaeon]